MHDYELLLTQKAPWTKPVLDGVKELNNQEFLRPRTGWIRRNVDRPESIFEHSCKVALAAHYFIGTKDAIAKGLCHDFPEIIEPDHIPWEIDKQEKNKREHDAMIEISKQIPNGEYYLALWLDFESNKGNSSQIHELDKMCPGIQSRIYTLHKNGDDLSEFYPYARSRLKTPSLIRILDEIQEIDDPSLVYSTYFEKLSKTNTNI